MQLRVRHIARNVLSNWLATAATVAVGLFLAPFMLHRLRPDAYGSWVTAISSINYLGMLDLGMRSSVLRFVSKGHTQGDHDAASAALSGALWVRLQISGLILVIAATLAYFFPILFKVPPDFALAARLAVTIVGINLALSMPMGVFGAVLSGLNRYDLQTGVILLQMTIRVAGVVFVLRKGYGIVAIAVCEFVAALVGNVLLVVVARKIYPQLRVILRRPAPEVLRSLWSYSLYAFLTTIAVQLVYQTDNLVVASFVSMSAVAFYSIGNSLCRYADQFIGAMSASFVPAASTFDAAGEKNRLRALYTVGTRAMMAVSLPVMTTLLVRGHRFIGLWMGAQYAERSGTVLVILASALIFTQANQSASAIGFGTERHRTVAKLAVGEGIGNLVLSIVLVRRLGIYGVAIGTLVPSLISQLIFWPRYISGLMGLSRWEIMGKIWSPMLLSAVPFAVASYLVDLRYPPHSIVMFIVQTVALLPLFLLALAVLFRDPLRQRALPAAREFLHTKTSLFAH